MCFPYVWGSGDVMMSRGLKKMKVPSLSEQVYMLDKLAKGMGIAAVGQRYGQELLIVAGEGQQWKAALFVETAVVRDIAKTHSW